MDKISAYKLIKDTFQNPFDKDRFLWFIKNALNEVDESKAFYARGYIPEIFKEFVKTYERIGKYKDPDGKELDILVVYLSRDSTLDRARTAQRNFIARYLKGRGEKDAGLIAFVPPSKQDWRFSFIKMEYTLTTTLLGKVKAKEEFTPARRYSFLVGENENSHTAQRRLVSLLANDSQNPLLNEIEEAFSVEKVSKEFFRQYKELYLRLKESLEDIAKADQKIKKDFEEKGVSIIDFAKKTLGQIVFLYFLQKKGWFGVQRDSEWGTGSKDFLRKLYDKKIVSYENFFNDVLEPLFYETLATERTHDYSALFKCKIPFLNGGLFDPINDYDWVHTDIIIPDKLFSNSKKTKDGDIGDGILDVFDRFNFTVKEDEPLEKEVAVDPEMLGKVFENLLEVKDRKSKGTYYTPREIVHYMCQESLINYLYTSVNEALAELPYEDPEQIKLIGKPKPKQIKLPVSGVKEFVSREEIETLIKYGETAVEHDSRVMQKGEETARYSFKLPLSIRNNAELIDKKLADIRVCDPAIGSGAFPVGMMNEIVRTRNALTSYIDNGDGDRSIYNFKRHAIQHSLYGVDIDASAVEIAKLRLWLSLIVDEEDIKRIKPLPNLDYKIVRGNSLLGVDRQDMFIDEKLKQIEHLKPLFFNETSTRKKQEHKNQIDLLICEITDGHKDFDFEVYFSEVFHEKGGFDLLIGNPPYDEISNKEDKTYFQKAFAQVLSGHYDLYIFFFKKAFDVVRNSGFISLITPHTYLHYTQFLNLRKWLYENSWIVEITGRISNVFEEAVVDNSVILIKLAKATQNSITKFTEKKIDQNRLIDERAVRLEFSEFSYDSFDLTAIENKRIIDRYSYNIEALGSIIESSQGITVYAKVQGEKINWFRKEKKDKETKPVVRGKNISRYLLYWDNEYIKYGKWLWCPRKPKYFESEKLLFRQTADSLIGTYIKEPLYCIDSVHSIIRNIHKPDYDLKYILAILNSKFGTYLYRLLISEAGKVFAQVKLTFLRRMPIKQALPREQKPFIDTVNSILAITAEDDYLENLEKQGKVCNYIQKIDEMVYTLYGLTKEEIEIVENATSK